MSRERQIWFWGIGFCVLIGLLWLLSSILLPFVAGMAIAYFLDPAADWLEARGCSRTLATSIIISGFLSATVLLILVLLPVLKGQILRLPDYITSLLELVNTGLAYMDTDQTRSLVDRAREFLNNSADEAFKIANDAIGKLLTGLFSIANALSLIFVAPVVTFYLLRDWDRMVERLHQLLPRDHAGTIRELVKESDEILSAFVRGTGMVCLSLGGFYAITLGLIGLEMGVIIGLGAGLISFVPYLGTVLGAVASIGMALVQYSDLTMVAVIAGVFILGQVIEGNFLTPKLVGDSVRLHPVWVIFAMFAFGTLFGFVGILMAVPVAAVIGVLVRFGVRQYLISPIYGGALPPDFKESVQELNDALADSDAYEQRLEDQKKAPPKAPAEDPST